LVMPRRGGRPFPTIKTSALASKPVTFNNIGNEAAYEDISTKSRLYPFWGFTVIIEANRLRRFNFSAYISALTKEINTRHKTSSR